MKMKFLFSSLIVNIILFLYCVSGVFQALSLGGGPNYSRDRLFTNLGLWIGLATVSLALSINLSVRLYRKRKMENR